MRVHAGAVAGNREAAGRDEAFCHGRAHGGKEQDVLEVSFEISGDVPAAYAGRFVKAFSDKKYKNFIKY